MATIETLPSFRPIAGGHLASAHPCSRMGSAGPCWGQTSWHERRDLIHGRAAVPLCQGHLGASYLPSTLAEDSSYVFTLTAAQVAEADSDTRGAWAASVLAAILADAGVSRADWRTHRAAGLRRISRMVGDRRQWVQVLIITRGYGASASVEVVFTCDTDNDGIAARLTAAARACGCTS